jgi:hypothetical protein
MPRQKRTSPALDKATQRMTGLRAISETLDLGNGITIEGYDAHIQAVQAQLAAYNKLISSIDESAVQLTRLEKDLQNYSAKVLINAAARFGKDSPQYMQAGGTMSKPTAKKRATTTPEDPLTPPTTTSRSAVLN